MKMSHHSQVSCSAQCLTIDAWIAVIPEMNDKWLHIFTEQQVAKVVTLCLCCTEWTSAGWVTITFLLYSRFLLVWLIWTAVHRCSNAFFFFPLWVTCRGATLRLTLSRYCMFCTRMILDSEDLLIFYSNTAPQNILKFFAGSVCPTSAHVFNHF